VERRGDAGLAAKLLKRAISVNSEEAYAFQCLGQLAARQRRWEEARGHFEAGLAVAQRNRGGANGGKLEATVLHSWAVMEMDLGDMWRARELFTSAMSLGVSEGWLYHLYAKFEAEHGDAWLARHYFARSINASPKDPRPWGDWAALEAVMGNEERAKSYGARASRLSVSKDLASGKVDAERPLGRKWRRNRGRSLNFADSHR
jgi:tetratricopeptide (TPR) repeat protein